MNFKNILSLLLLTGACCRADMFLNVTGAPGDSVVSGFAGQISVEAMSWGASTSVRIGTGGAGDTVSPPNIADLTISKSMDKASPILTFDCVSGTKIDHVVLTVRTTSQTPAVYYVVTLDNAYVTSVSTAGDTSARPSESVSFAFQKITWSYTPPGGDSSTTITHSYDVKNQTSN